MNCFLRLFFLCITTVAFSQEVTDSLKSNQLEEVKLESQRYIKSKRNSSQQIQTISQKEIELGNYQTTAEVLSNSGKLFVQKSQQGGGSPVIRGLESNRILLLVDGVRMNNLIFRGGHLQNVISVDENMLENTDILFGASSTPYGSDALGGAINLITKRPFLLSDKNTKRFSASLNTRYATANNEQSGYGDFRFSGGKWATLTAISYNDFGDLRMGSKKNSHNDFFGTRSNYIETVNGVDTIVKNDNPLVQKFSGYKQYNAMQKVLFKPNATTEHSLNLQYSTTSDIPRYDRLTDISSNGDLKTATWNYGPQKRILAGYMFNKEKALLNSDLTIGVDYQNIEESRITRKYKSTSEESRLEKVNVYSINADLKTKIGKGELLYGIEAFYDDLNSTANAVDIITGIIKPIDTRYPNGENFTLKTDVFATYISKLTENTSYNLGGRVGYSKLHSDIADNSFLSLPFTEINQKNTTYSATAGIANNSTKNVKVSFNVGTGFRTPNIDDLAKVFESTAGVLIVPNENLKPEKNITGDFNITLYDDKIFELDNTVFYTRLYDFIVTSNFLFNNQSTIVYDGTSSIVQANQNLGKASIFGYSTALKINFLKSLKFYGSFNFTYGRLESDGTNTEKPLDHIPPFYGKTGFNYENKWINFDLNMLYNGKKHLEDYSASGEDNLVYAPVNGMPAWQTYNFKAAVKPFEDFTVFSGLENILDIQYRNFASGINASGRNFYIGAKYTL
ncbi:TonB-dependent receptor plug domain-containing protein [Flavobacterium sp.]|uniref:TonB-dependent receptor plug domain-containing protein n=1 Tax=Flavobacterium sp. TaxID=239 RepID=UPI00374D9652